MQKSAIWANQPYACSAQVVITSSAHLQNQVRSVSNQEIQRGADCPNSDPQLRSSDSPKSWFSHAQARILKHNPTYCGECLWPHLTKRAGDNSWKQCSPAALQLRNRKKAQCMASPICRAAKLVGSPHQGIQCTLWHY